MQTHYITIEDLTAVVNLVDVVTTRGGLRGNELSPIARLRDVCEAEAKHQTEERIKQQQEALLQQQEQEELKKTSENNALANERQQRKELQQRLDRLQAEMQRQGLETDVPKAVKVETTTRPQTPVVANDEPKKPSRAVKMAQMFREQADDFVSGDVTEDTPSAVEDAANVMSNYEPSISDVKESTDFVVPETHSQEETQKVSTDDLFAQVRVKSEEEQKAEPEVTVEDPFEEFTEEGETLVIPDKKELNAMTKATIKEVAEGLGLEVNLKDTKVNMIKSFDKQAKKMVKELTDAGEVESNIESDWTEASYTKD